MDAMKASGVVWIKDGQPASVPAVVKTGQECVAVEQLAKFSGSQLRWQPVSQEACITNEQGALCFDWGKNEVSKDEGAPKKIALTFENSELWIPVSFVATKEFKNFAQSNVDWRPKEKEIHQTAFITLTTPRVEKLSDRYRLTMRASDEYPRYLIEKSQDKVWLRFMRANSEGSQILEGDSVIQEVRVAQKRHSADVIISLGDDAEETDVYMDEGSGLVTVDVAFSDRVARDGFTEPAPPLKPVAVSSVKPKPRAVVKAPPQKPLPVPKRVVSTPVVRSPASRKNVLIVIDAGHGGMDSGALGARGTNEKDINLQVAKSVANLLEKEKGIQVIMTRDTDVFIPLSQRTQIANNAGADLFVSIHCNSSLSPKQTGFEAYYLASEATDKAAESVARLENSVVALEAHKGAGTSKLENLLASMAVSNFINESSKCAGYICRNIRNQTSMDKTEVKEADFYVLRGAQMPAVLIELEYLSNPISELKLRNSRFQNQMAKAILGGLRTYEQEARREREAMAAQIGIKVPVER